RPTPLSAIRPWRVSHASTFPDRSIASLLKYRTSNSIPNGPHCGRGFTRTTSLSGFGPPGTSAELQGPQSVVWHDQHLPLRYGRYPSLIGVISSGVSIGRFFSMVILRGDSLSLVAAMPLTLRWIVASRDRMPAASSFEPCRRRGN